MGMSKNTPVALTVTGILIIVLWRGPPVLRRGLPIRRGGPLPIQRPIPELLVVSLFQRVDPLGKGFMGYRQIPKPDKRPHDLNVDHHCTIAVHKKYSWCNLKLLQIAG